MKMAKLAQKASNVGNRKIDKIEGERGRRTRSNENLIISTEKAEERQEIKIKLILTLQMSEPVKGIIGVFESDKSGETTMQNGRSWSSGEYVDFL
jgi:hypothetical protein